MPTGRPDRAKHLAIGGIAGQHRHQPAIGELLPHEEVRNIGETESLFCKRDQWLDGSRGKQRRQVHLQHVVAIAQQPAVDLAGRWVTMQHAGVLVFDQFLQDGSNKRTDIYGGSFENRARFLLDATRAVISVWGSDRVAVRLGPSGAFGDMSDSDPEGLFTYVAAELGKLNLAYLHLIEPRVRGNLDDETRSPNPVASQLIRKFYSGTIIAAGGFKGASAEAIITAGDADLVAFGRDFIANPDLPERLLRRQPLNPYDRETFFGGTDVGYIDYPFYEERAAA